MTVQDTSRTAKALAPNRKAVIYELIVATSPKGYMGGVADWEIAEILGIPYSAVQAPRGELVKEGKVKDSGHRNLTKYQRPAIVWVSV
jgi:predicted transcriptional regulator